MRFVAPVLTGAVALALSGFAPSPPQRLDDPTEPRLAGDPVIAAVGDMACDPADPRFNGGAGTSTACAQDRTSDRLMADSTIDAVLGLGDYQYDCGSSADYKVSYNPTWGRLDSLMRPSVGNHEYETGTDSFGGTCPSSNSTADNYFDHFGPVASRSTAGHFSFNLGGWHLIALNGNCSRTNVGGCSATSAQTKWLRTDLANNTKKCIAAFWHQPLFTGLSSINTTYRPWWQVLSEYRADVVLNGHTHNYQRYAPRTPFGALSSNGITEYVVGTGGASLASVSSNATVKPVTWKKTFGHLRMVLHYGSWDAKFIDYRGVVLDTSSGTCH
jgi:hypothetical protein